MAIDVVLAPGLAETLPGRDSCEYLVAVRIGYWISFTRGVGIDAVVDAAVVKRDRLTGEIDQSDIDRLTRSGDRWIDGRSSARRAARNLGASREREGDECEQSGRVFHGDRYQIAGAQFIV